MVNDEKHFFNGSEKTDAEPHFNKPTIGNIRSELSVLKKRITDERSKFLSFFFPVCAMIHCMYVHW